MTAPAPRPRLAPRWTPPAAPEVPVLGTLASELRLPDTICTLLASRGYYAPDDAKRFLRPRLEHLHPPGGMRGMSTAVERLVRAARQGETVLVHGDYDVDGICSATIMVRVLRELGAKAIPFLPHRITDGYDLTNAGVQAALRERASVVLTCDCGTSAHDAIAALCAAGVDVIVSDHHLPSREVPTCLAVLNPRQPDCEYPDKDLCAAGVAFKLSVALLEAMGESTNLAFHLLDLVALATVADVAPLRGENRVLVRFGLKMLAETRNVGLRALMDAAGIEPSTITAGRVGFILAPRLNAAGRVGHAMRGVELLMAEDQGTANRIARELEELNRDRQELDRRTLEEALRKADALDLDQTYGVVLWERGWHPGVIGIVASRLVEQLARPVFLVAVEDGVGKGSGRSISAFDLHGALTACKAHLTRYGGHRAAAGLTISEAELPAFAARFNEVARERLTPDDLVPRLRVDLELDVDDISGELEGLLRHFEPFGLGNPAPVLAVRGVKLAGPARVVGQGGLKLQLQTGRGQLEAIGWGMGDRARELAPGKAVDIAFRLERDTYRGETKLVARLADLRA